MDAFAWMLKYVKGMPLDGVLLIKGHPDEEKLIEIGKRLIEEYNKTFVDYHNFVLEFKNDYSELRKVMIPF